ncbi:MAG: helix-turn-helix transcriptional regulator [Tissierellia bacterium]|nr:helix-turn-helix transcriptional regulator [Tissierellia bacterium]MDD4779596.1 helix-turn-helix transcriptional regulator [Tissierellia bacterium]
MKENIIILIGKRLRKQREKLNMTREEFAEKANISPQFLAEIENGKKGMSVSTLYKICNNYNISADYILFGRLSSNNAFPLTTKSLSEPYLSYTEDIIEIVNNIILETQNSYKSTQKKD